ncbi:MAG: hypothetical protein K0S01_1766 [Herbinix sp.]|jgi:hypothetical protein|nr:hypothetical protein [Herbinix sp.]
MNKQNIYKSMCDLTDKSIDKLTAWTYNVNMKIKNKYLDNMRLSGSNTLYTVEENIEETECNCNDNRISQDVSLQNI